MNDEHEGDIRAFNVDFKVVPAPTSFNSLKRKLVSMEIRPGKRPNVLNKFMEWPAGDYYRILVGEIRRVDPNHLMLGDRYASHYSQAVVRAEGKYLDVVSVNLNTYAQSGWTSPAFLDTAYRLAGKPIMVTEFYAAAMENRSGNMNRSGPFFVVQTQKQRADGTEAMAEQMARLPYVVGCHWFQWADEPPKGRGGDGEDFNMGLVDIEDRPYEELTAAFTRVNKNITKLHVAGPRPAGPVSSDKAWEVPASSSSVTMDGRLDDWSCRDSWVSGVAARTPWLPFADFHVTWKPAGLLVGMVYDEFFSGGGEGGVLADRQRIVLTVAAGEGGPAQVTLVGFGDRMGPAPTDPEENDRPLAMLLPFAGKDNEPPARLASVSTDHHLPKASRLRSGHCTS